MFNSCEDENNSKVRGLLFIQIEFNPHFQDNFPYILSVQGDKWCWSTCLPVVKVYILSNYFLNML